VAHLREADGGDEADISGPDNGNLNGIVHHGEISYILLEHS